MPVDKTSLADMIMKAPTGSGLWPIRDGAPPPIPSSVVMHQDRDGRILIVELPRLARFSINDDFSMIVREARFDQEEQTIRIEADNGRADYQVIALDRHNGTITGRLRTYTLKARGS